MGRFYVGNLPYTAHKDEFRAWFEDQGIDVQDSFIVMDRETRQSKGFGFVTVVDEHDSKTAALNGATFSGRALRVNEATEKGRSAPRSDAPRSPRSDAPRSDAPRYPRTSSPISAPSLGPDSSRLRPAKAPFSSSEFDKPKRKSPQERRRPKNRQWDNFEE